jgi:general secretion pathway protein G
MIIVVILGTVGTGAYQSYINRTRIARAIADISALAVEIAKFDGLNQRFPDNLAELGLDPQRYTDPWGNSYQYLNLDLIAGVGGARKDHNNVQMNRDFDLYSFGPDGLTNQTFTATASQDDIVRALSGQWVGTTEEWAASY